jgi:hypothetical protein
MLRENPENRPQDPVAFESELRDCLTKIERRQAIGRRLGIPLAAVIPKKPKKQREPKTPLAQVLRGFLAFALLLLAATALGAYLFPDAIPLWHRSAKMVGVPDASSVMPSQTTTAAPIVANQPVTNADPAVSNASQNLSPSAQQAQVSNSQPDATLNQTVTNAEPAASNEGQNLSPNAQQAQVSNSQPDATSNPVNAPTPAASASAQVASAANAAAPARPSSSDSKKKALASASSRTSTAKRARIPRALPNEEESELSPLHRDRGRARLVGTTPDGRVILRLPSGRIVTVRSRSDDEDVFVPHPRRRVFLERPDVFAPPPFYPPGYFPND